MYLAEVQLCLVRASLIFVSLSRRSLLTLIYSVMIVWFNICTYIYIYIPADVAWNVFTWCVCHAAGLCLVFWVRPKIASYYHHRRRRHRRNCSPDTHNAGRVVYGMYEIGPFVSGVRGSNHAWGIDTGPRCSVACCLLEV